MVEEPQQHRRLAAIMFTDMVGYSALSQKNEALALELLNEHRKLSRERFASHGGREIEAVGDGFFVECPSALAAARCAVDIQRTLHDRNASQAPDRQIQIRIGLHLGDVVAEDTRVHGDGVNIAARFEPLAEPGGICLSEDLARQIQNKIELPRPGLPRHLELQAHCECQDERSNRPSVSRHGIRAGHHLYARRALGGVMPCGKTRS